MNRKEFLQKSAKLGLGSTALLVLNQVNGEARGQANQTDQLAVVQREKEFIQNWLADLLDSMDAVLDEETKVKIIEGCGRGCFRRFKFKQDLAKEGAGDVDKLIQALKKNFEVWREGNQVHIRYGVESKGCYCPAARYRSAKPNDPHCHCTKATHQTIWETALGRPFKVDILETVRRGGKTCHFLVHLT
ncbi:MAG: hypothetical protein EHM23_17630 [Acidobacteria bacterium]|nr:MAG: hypothetical protein EHM23_17630 [Acidobacteriota bacterium]